MQSGNGLGKVLIPLGIAAAVQWFQNSNTSPPPQPQSFNFVNQPTTSLFSKALSFFGASSSQLASPDIPTQSPQSAQYHPPQAILPRMVPGIGFVQDTAGRIVGPQTMFTEQNLAREEVTQSLVQSPPKIPVHSFIGDALKPVDGGLLSHITSQLGIADPELDPMSKILLNNVDNLVHIKNRESEPMLLGMNFEPPMPSSPDNPTAPVTYNVFDDRTSPALKRAIKSAPTYQLPPVAGVPFDDA
jgi:hypothetical protein